MRRLLLVLLCGALAAAQEEETAFVVSGRVVDQKGKPAPGVGIQVRDAFRGHRFLAEGSSGEDGAFRIPLGYSQVMRCEHPFGPVMVVFRGEGLAEQVQAVTPDAKELNVSLLPARVVRGTVVDHEGKPVAGAVVSAQCEKNGSVTEEVTTTGEDGQFVLRRLAKGMVSMKVSHDGVHASLLTEDQTVECRLPSARVVRGRVLTEDGAAVADARVLLPGGTPLAESDADGRFEAVLPAFTDLFVEAPGYAVARVQHGEGDQLAVVLKAAPPLHGRVVDAEDKPLSDCRVTVGDALLRGGVWTDEQGRFSFESPPGGTTWLRVARAGYVPRSLSLETGRRDFVTLRLEKGARIAGVVREDGKPALGARIFFFPGDAAVAYADSHGRFVARGVPREARWVVAELGEEWPAAARLVAQSVAVQLGDRPLPPLDLRLERKLPLRGILKSDAGHPLAGVRCRVLDSHSMTDAEGRFEFASVPVGDQTLTAKVEDHADVRASCRPGYPVEIVAASRFGTSTLRVVVHPRVLNTEVTIQRREGPRVRRRGKRFENLPPGVYDVSVRAPGYVEVTKTVELKDEATVEIRLERGGTLRLAASPGATVAVQTLEGRDAPVAVLELADGTQTLEGFGPGTYRFIARGRGELIVVREVGLGPNAPPVELDLRGGKSSELTVEVTDAAGAPVADAEITLLTEGGFEWNTRKRTDAEGRIVLKRLIEGRLHVRAQLGNRIGEAAITITPARVLRIAVPIR